MTRLSAGIFATKASNFCSLTTANVADEPLVSQRILERLMLGRVCGPYPRGKTGWCRTEESGASPGPSLEK